MFSGRMVASFFGGIVVSVCSLTFVMPAVTAEAKGAKYMSNSGCKCHMGKGCFEGEDYKERLHRNTWDERLKGTADEDNPECLKCHATAVGEPIKKKYQDKKYLPNVLCEACHGAGEDYVKLKKNYQGKGKDAFKELLKKDPLLARKEQYDAGLLVAGITTDSVKDQCLKCHWETADAKNKCPKTDKVMDYKEYFKKDDHRDQDAIDDVIKKMSPADKKKWASILPKDDILYSPLKKH
ncbi:MAG: cytochrome c family protein [Candidatus Brocadiaceae bacterium]|nr:cytochrome c family protein [Candidatus Brocadiaceae bacterium]